MSEAYIQQILKRMVREGRLIQCYKKRNYAERGSTRKRLVYYNRVIKTKI
jgi:hypothetical protein